MQHLAVDFNTMTSAPEGLVKFPERYAGTVREGERVTLTDGEMEVEATVIRVETAWGAQALVAEPDEATWRDLPPDAPSDKPKEE